MTDFQLSFSDDGISTCNTMFTKRITIHLLPNTTVYLFSFIFFLFLATLWHMEFLGQESNLHPGAALIHCTRGGTPKHFSLLVAVFLIKNPASKKLQKSVKKHKSQHVKFRNFNLLAIIRKVILSALQNQHTDAIHSAETWLSRKCQYSICHKLNHIVSFAMRDNIATSYRDQDMENFGLLFYLPGSPTPPQRFHMHPKCKMHSPYPKLLESQPITASKVQKSHLNIII